MDSKDTVLAAITELTTRQQLDFSGLLRPDYREHLEGSAETGAGVSGLVPGTRYDVARVIADGDLVLTHARITAAGQPVLVGVDLWRLVDGRLAERWSSRTLEIERTASGRSQLDGAAEPDPAADTAASKRLVTDWTRAVLLGGDLTAVPEYLSEETYWQHNPDVADGIDGFAAAVARLSDVGLSFDYESIDITIAQGDFVFTRGVGKLGPDVIFNDVWRVAGGRIVEHWDVVSPVGSATSDAHRMTVVESETLVRTHGLGPPFLQFLRTTTGSSIVLLGSIVAGLVWANLSPNGYESVWRTPLTVHLGAQQLGLDLREWVSSGLMTFFFVVVGLEARRELDLGTLRQRRRLVIPVTAGLVGMVLPVAIFLIVTAGTPANHGWGVAMSTDTALALGLVSLVSRHLPAPVRAFLVTLFVVDDVVALIVIAVVYSGRVAPLPVLASIAVFALYAVGRRLTWPAPVTVALAGIAWLELLIGGVDPVVVGLAIGISTPAYSPTRGALEAASGEFRRFREQPTSAFARTASSRLLSSLSPNERLQSYFLPSTTYVIVPLFALSNSGIPIDTAFLAKAYAAPLTIAIIAAYVLGKPVAIITTSAVITRLSRGRLRPPVGWTAVVGSGTIAGVGFTVAILIATLAFTGTALNEAKLAVLTAAILATVLTGLVQAITNTLPSARRTRALLGDGDSVTDLTTPLDLGRDHVRGPVTADVVLIEYGDFQCPYCGMAEPAVRSLEVDAEILFVWRHLPLLDVHPQARLAAEAAEAAAAQGAFWKMHDLLLRHQAELKRHDLIAYATELRLDVQAFEEALASGTYRARVTQDLETADLSGVSGTPTFFVNGRRHYGAYDAPSLRAAIATARELQSALDRRNTKTRTGSSGYEN